MGVMTPALTLFIAWDHWWVALIDLVILVAIIVGVVRWVRRPR